MLERPLWRSKPVVRHQRLRRLRLVGAVWNHRFNRGIGFLHVAPWLSGRKSHDLIEKIGTNEVLGRGNVFHHLRNGPSIGSRLEVPLRLGKAFGCVQHSFPGGLEVLESVLLFGLREFLGRDRRDSGQRQHRDQDAIHGSIPHLRILLVLRKKPLIFLLNLQSLLLVLTSLVASRSAASLKAMSASFQNPSSQSRNASIPRASTA